MNSGVTAFKLSCPTYKNHLISSVMALEKIKLNINEFDTEEIRVLLWHS